MNQIYVKSTSLNVVNIAVTFCASFKRSAIRRRIRFILMRVSERSPVTSFESAKNIFLNKFFIKVLNTL